MCVWLHLLFHVPCNVKGVFDMLKIRRGSIYLSFANIETGNARTHPSSFSTERRAIYPEVMLFDFSAVKDDVKVCWSVVVGRLNGP